MRAGLPLPRLAKQARCLFGCGVTSVAAAVWLCARIMEAGNRGFGGAMKFTKCGIVMLLVWPAGIAAAQQQTTTPAAQQAAGQKQDQKEQDPLVVAARRAREQKKEQPKAAKTWDNDNIPTTPDSISVVGESNSTDESRDKATSEKTASQSNSGAAAAEEKNEAGRNSAE